MPDETNTDAMKTLMRIMLVTTLLMAGFAAGYPVGRSKGFLMGSEWSFVQANILAREAGIFMPVNYEAGEFRVILKQPKHLYKSSWMLADRHENEMTSMSSRGDVILNERMPRLHRAALTQSKALAAMDSSVSLVRFDTAILK